MGAMNGYLTTDAVSFEIIDAETGNTIASFEHVHDAESAVRRILDRDITQAEDLVVVAFDKMGNAIGSEPAMQLLVP
jgi:hypothetical protein